MSIDSPYKYIDIGSSNGIISKHFSVFYFIECEKTS